MDQFFVLNGSLTIGNESCHGAPRRGAPCVMMKFFVVKCKGPPCHHLNLDFGKVTSWNWPKPANKIY